MEISREALTTWAALDFSSPSGRWSRIVLEKINTRIFLCVSRPR